MLSSHGSNKLFYGLIGLVVIIAVGYQWLVPYPFVGREQPHYISVCWYMWQYRDWLVLHDSAGLYLNKPPLLFWLVNIIWHLFGINNWVFRAIPAFAAIGTLIVLRKTYQQLWPEAQSYAWLAAAFFLGCTLQYVPLFMFDLLVTFFTALALYGLVHAMRNHDWGWWLLALGNGLGILTKGPVVLVFTLVPAILATFCFNHIKTDYKRWLLKLLLSTLLALAIAALWVVPLYLKLHSDTLVSALSIRMFGSRRFYGPEAWWYYLPKLPLLLLPWVLWPQWYSIMWPPLRRLRDNDQLRWLVLSSITSLVIMSTVPAKRERYILSLIIYIALSFAYCCSQLRQSSAKDYRNWVLMITLLVMGVAILVVAPLVLPHVHLPFRITWSSLLIPGILFTMAAFLLLSIKASGFKSLNYAVITQCGIMCLILLGYAAVPLRLDLQSRQLAQFEQCVRQAMLKNNPIGFQARYSGYWYHVNEQMMPFGVILPSHQAMVQFLTEHPHGLLIMESGIPDSEIADPQVPLPATQVVCSTPPKTSTPFVAVILKNDSMR